ncbi:MAG: hypothetical protein ACXW2P_12685 [Thermoanaerobaculia bacterium]
MKRFQSFILLLVLLGGCFRSIHPIYTTDDLVFDPALIGEWIAESETWTVTRAGANGYRIVHADESGRSGVFVGHLIEVKGYRFIDLLPVQTELRATHLHADAHLPLHTLALVIRTTPTPQFATFRGDWFNELLSAQPQALRHERVGNEIVITASTREIQAFLVRHADNREAFDIPAPWRRASD